jgi:hypothetical protein
MYMYDGYRFSNTSGTDKEIGQYVHMVMSMYLHVCVVYVVCAEVFRQFILTEGFEGRELKK